jgi:hypothetical protein
MEAASGVDDMTTFITQARFTKDGFNGIVAAPEDRVELVERLMLIFEASSYEASVPALIVAAAGSGVADLRTVTALTSSEMKNAFVKAASIAASDRSAAAPASQVSAVEPLTTNPERPPAGQTVGEDQADAKSATAILDAQKKAVEDTRAGRPAPYYFAPRSVPASQPAASPRSANGEDAAKK